MADLIAIGYPDVDDEKELQAALHGDQATA